MMTITRGLLAGVALFGAAVGLAGPASAQLEPGSYTATSISQDQFAGMKSPRAITSCGQNCLAVLDANGKTVNFQLQGNTWTGNDPECVQTIDNTSLIIRAACGSVVVESQLTRNG